MTDISSRTFPTDALPPMMQEVVRTSAILNRVPEGLPAMCCLGAVSASLGRALVIRSGPGRLTRANLYLIGGAGSGDGKSEVIRRIMDPLYKMQQVKREKFEREERPHLLGRKSGIAARIKQLEKEGSRKGVPDIPELTQLHSDLLVIEDRLRARQFACEDATPEALSMILAANQETQFSVSADAREAMAVLQGRYAKGQSHDGLYVRCYSGDPCTVNRVSRPHIHLVSPCLSLLWLVQPDKFFELYGKAELSASGFLPRTLPACFDVPPQKIDVTITEGILSAAFEPWNRHITDLGTAYRCSEQEHVIVPEPLALNLLVRDFDNNHELAHGEYADIPSFVARWTEWAWRLAVCLHAARHWSEAHRHSLTFETAMAALRIRDWFKSQQLEILQSGRVTAKIQLEQKVLALVADNVEGITSADLYRSRVVPNAAAAHQLLKDMEQAGKLVGEDSKPPGGGKVSRIYRYNMQSSNPVPE